MITRACTERCEADFLEACGGRLCFGAVLPLELELFGKALPGRFYSAPGLALDIGGGTAWAAGAAEPEELGAFLRFCGCEAVLIDEAVCPPPAGWHRASTRTIFGIEPYSALPLPEAKLWGSLALDKAPSPSAVADALFAGRGQRRDDFYSGLCTKLVRGRAVVWALEAEGKMACTVGAYAINAGQAYMACGQTAEPLRGQGIGGRLIVSMANELAAGGLRPVFMCAPERVRFYTRLGFKNQGALAVYRCEAG